MEADKMLQSFCCFCQSGINVEVSDSSVEVCHKFQIYAIKFLNSCSQEKFEVTNESVSDLLSGEDENCRNKMITSCAECNIEIETFCEMWESRESLQAEMISAVVNIYDLPKNKFQPKSEISEQSPEHCLICYAVPMSRSSLPRRILSMKTCVKFTTFVTRFILNTEKPCFDKKILEIFVEEGKRRNSEVETLYCCDICLPQIMTFCEIYEALESLQLEILHILDRFTIKNQCKDFQSKVEKQRKLSFPRVSLQRLPTRIHKLEQNQPQSDGTTASTATIKRDLEAQNQNENHQLEDDFFDNFEITSAPTPSPPSFQLHDNGNETETVPKNINQAAADIFESSSNVTPSMTMSIMSTKKRGTKRKYDYPLECLFCKQKFKTNLQLETHLQSHASEKWFWCRICGQELLTRNNLSNHRKSNVHKEITIRPHKCEICGTAYFHLQDLHKHSNLYHNTTNVDPKRPFSCDICGKTFTKLTYCQTHKRFVHEGGYLPEVCHICGKTVSSTFYMGIHLNKYHRSEIDDSLKKEKEFKCTLTDCQATFYRRCGFDRHMLTHTGEKNFACEECGKSFALKDNLKRHKECHKEVRPHVCGHCGKGFNYRYRLTQHEKKYHRT